MLRYLGQPITKAEVKVNPDYKKWEKLSGKAPKDMSNKELKQFIAFTNRPPDPNYVSGRDIAELDKDGKMVRAFPKDEKGKLIRKQAFNGRYSFYPENDYVGQVPLVDAHKLMKLKTSGGHDLFIEEGNLVEKLTARIQEQAKEMAAMEKKFKLEPEKK